MVVESTTPFLTTKPLLSLWRSEKGGRHTKCRRLVGGEGFCAQTMSWRSRAEEASGNRRWVAVCGRERVGRKGAREGGVGLLLRGSDPWGHSQGWATRGLAPSCAVARRDFSICLGLGLSQARRSPWYSRLKKD